MINTRIQNSEMSDYPAVDIVFVFTCIQAGRDMQASLEPRVQIVLANEYRRDCISEFQQYIYKFDGLNGTYLTYEPVSIVTTSNICFY
jgi:hypothetical protein